MGSRAGVLLKFALDNSYPTGGYSLSAAAIGISQIQAFLPIGEQGGFLYDYNLSTQKLRILQSNSTDSGLSSQLSFAPPSPTSVRLYYTPGIGTFKAGDFITDTTVVGNTTATIASVNLVEGYIDVSGVLGANLFNVGDNIQTGGAEKTGTVSFPAAVAPGSPAALYVFTFPSDIWPLGPVVGAVSGVGSVGSIIDVVSSTGAPAIDALRMTTAAGYLEGELLVTTATQVTAISTRVLQGSSSAPFAELPAGTDLSAYTGLEALVIGV